VSSDAELFAPSEERVASTAAEFLLACGRTGSRRPRTLTVRAFGLSVFLSRAVADAYVADPYPTIGKRLPLGAPQAGSERASPAGAPALTAWSPRRAMTCRTTRGEDHSFGLAKDAA
jgi:hypothetical protein